MRDSASRLWHSLAPILSSYLMYLKISINPILLLLIGYKRPDRESNPGHGLDRAICCLYTIRALCFCSNYHNINLLVKYPCARIRTGNLPGSAECLSSIAMCFVRHHLQPDAPPLSYAGNTKKEKKSLYKSFCFIFLGQHLGLLYLAHNHLLYLQHVHPVLGLLQTYLSPK